jgi:hypothetical protein
VHNLGAGGFDRESGRDKPAEAAPAGPGAVRGGEFSVAVGTRTRGEARAGLRQAAGSGWDRHRRFEAPRGELAAFRAGDAGLPEVSAAQAARYIERHRAGRPWLCGPPNVPARRQCGSSRRPTRAAGTGTSATTAG